jgi:hypothetical protein
MKKNYKTTIGVFALAAIALTGSQIAANAYQGDYTKQGPNYSELIWYDLFISGRSSS